MHRVPLTLIHDYWVDPENDVAWFESNDSRSTNSNRFR